MTGPVSPPSAPRLSFLATLRVQVGSPIEVGQTPEGFRRIIPIIGGTVEGPTLRGKILQAGADFQLLKSETLTELQANYAIETDDGERIYVSNFGLRSGSREDIAKLVDGQKVAPERIYFRCTPRMASHGTWAWLGAKILIGSGERHPEAVHLHVHVVE